MESNSFSQPWNHSDTVIIVENSKLHVHKSVLSICSPVFNTMLTSDFKEGTTMEIRLPGKQKDKVIEMLQHMYPFPAQITGMTNAAQAMT